MADLWDDSTDQLLDDIDNSIFSDYNIHVKELLNNPYKFSNQTDILTKVDKMKDDSNAYIDDLLDTLIEERKNFDNKAAAANAVTNQLNQMITLAAKQKNIPIIKPTLFFIDQTKLDILYIEKNDQSVTSLINKILPITTYISDMGITYKGYNFGDWTFATETNKNYNIKVYIPSNITFQIEQNKDKINMLFDTAKNALAEIVSKNTSKK